MLKLLRFLKPIDCLLISILIVIFAGQVYLDLFLPDRIQDILSLFGGATKPSLAQIMWNFLYAILFVFGSFFCIVFTSKLSATICNDYAYEIRKNLFSHVNKLSAKEIEIFGIPSLINRNTSDAVKVARGLEFALKLGITAPGAMIGGIIKISIDSSKGLDSQLAANTFTVAIVISIVVLLLSLGVIAAIILPRFKKQVKLLDELNEKARESISGVRVIRAFNAQSLHTKNFNEVNERNYKNNIILFFGTSSAFPIISSIINYITITIYWLGAYFIFKGNNDINVSILVKYTMLANVIIFAFVRSIMLIFFIPNAIISGKRINELFKLKPGIKSGKGKTINKNAKYVVEFENVNFKFTQTAPEDTIKNISFKLKQGETLAIIGATGSGKSIITKLIPRLFNPTNGKIKYYDKDIETYDLNFLRDSIGYVPQKTFLFNKSIKDNVSYGITKKMKQTEIDANVKEACKLACADQFINKFKDKYDHIISQNATNLSGGQKQRISIARALVRKPNLLIFDDSFSALDMTTDKTIRSNIKTKLKNTTKIIVAQRINTIIDAQNIVVVDRGQVVGQGTHKQLLKSCKVYYNFAISQLSRKELNNVK